MIPGWLVPPSCRRARWRSWSRPRCVVGIRSIQAHRQLLHPEALFELDDVDDAAAVGAVTDLAVAVPGLDFEHHALAVDLDNASNGADSTTRWGCARCRTLTSMPTLTNPSGRYEAMAEPDAISYAGSSSAWHRPAACAPRNDRPSSPRSRSRPFPAVMPIETLSSASMSASSAILL